MAEETMDMQPEAAAPAAPGWMPEQATLGPVKPKNNVYTFLLIVAALFVCASIYLVAYELNKFYSVTFGGLVSPPTPASTTPPEEKPSK
ncbi:MAG: hypothetical protein V1701_12030 [Planctomycetota bacterium]